MSPSSIATKLTGPWPFATAGLLAFVLFVFAALLPNHAPARALTEADASGAVQVSYGWSPRRITNKTGAVVWAADYDAYGKAIVRTSADASLALTSRLSFPVQCFDAEYSAYCNWRMNATTDCLKSCLWSLLPMPDPCDKFGKLVSLGLGLDNSFAADTLVHVRPQGASSLDAMRGKSEKKAIKDLKPGDEVLAFAEWQDPGQVQTDSGDKLDQRLSYQKVSDMVTSTREQRVVHLTLDDGQTIEATDGHPFKTTDGWRDAILLKKGGKLLLKGSGDADSEGKQAVGRYGVEHGAIAVVANNATPETLPTLRERAATITDVRIEVKTLPVFNIEVANAHTFFVGADGVLVHNAKCGSGSFPIARRVNLSSKKDAYERAKRAGGGVEPVLHPADFHGNPKPHYHPDVSMPKEWTPKGPNPHDHYNFPRGK